MTAPRWVVEYPGTPPTGGWVEYPTEADAITAAGTAAKVWALVTPADVRVLEAAAEWRRWWKSDPPYVAGSRLVAAVDILTGPAGQDPIAAIAEAHPLTFESQSPGLPPVCGCGWRGDFILNERSAFAEHAAHVHVAAGLATEEDA